jgi:hypothetical protein
MFTRLRSRCFHFGERQVDKLSKMAVVMSPLMFSVCVNSFVYCSFATVFSAVELAKFVRDSNTVIKND